MTATGIDEPGFMLPLRLFAAFRSLVDALHAELAEQGHPGMRPMYGFALQAIGARGTTATELAGRLGVSKQAAGKIVDRLETIGYVERVTDDLDARRKLVRLTNHGIDSLAKAAMIFQRLHDEWADRLGDRRLRAFERDLAAMTADADLRFDVPGWFGG
jgi:DNA-binding MarR family transcriptional regulator